MARFGALSLVALAFVGGCAGLPASGPSTSDLTRDAQEDQAQRLYELVDLSPVVLAALNERRGESFSGRFGDYRSAPEIRIGVGDFVAVTIWEAGAGGLFSAPLQMDRFSPGSRTATIPEQAVARDGTISVPYAGRIVVAGRTGAQVRQQSNVSSRTRRSSLRFS